MPLVFLSLATSGANTPLVENGISSVKKQSLCSGIKNWNLWLHYKENIKHFGRETATKKSIYKPYIICSVNLITSVQEVGLINDQLLKLR